MTTGSNLRELFSFPGFVAAAALKGVFGDPKERIVTLRRRKTAVCSQCGHRCRSRYDKRVCRARDLRVAGRVLLVEFERWRVDCPGCGGVHVERLDWLAKSPRYTERFALHVGNLCRSMTNKAVAELERLHDSAVKDLAPLSSASAATRRAFSKWFATLMGREVPYTYTVYLMELMELRDEGHTGKTQGGSTSGRSKGKPAGISTRLMTPEQLALRIVQQAATGKAGEAIAQRDEIERLRGLGAENPGQRVEHTAIKNVAAGYELESTTSAERRLIEVKSSTHGFSQGFFCRATNGRRSKKPAMTHRSTS